MGTAEQTILAGVITALIGVIAGYFLTRLSDYTNRNRLRCHLLKQLWEDLKTYPPDKVDPSNACIIGPQRLSVIDSMLSSGILGDQKEHLALLKIILNLRGYFTGVALNWITIVKHRIAAIIEDN